MLRNNEVEAHGGKEGQSVHQMDQRNVRTRMLATCENQEED